MLETGRVSESISRFENDKILENFKNPNLVFQAWFRCIRLFGFSIFQTASDESSSSNPSLNQFY